MRQGIIFGILATLLSVVLVFSSTNPIDGSAEVVIIHDGEEIFSSPFLKEGQQVIWFIESKNEDPFVLKNQEIIDYFDLKIKTEQLSELAAIDFEQIYQQVGTDAHINMILNQDGYVTAYEANCPDKLDVKMGKIYDSTKVITCVPHKLVIKIRGIEGNGDLDA